MWEDYVSFETAKLLKEKGFKIPYDSFRGVYINGIFKRLNPGDAYGYNLGDEIINVCSLQMAMKWLREKHNLYADIILHSVNRTLIYEARIDKINSPSDIDVILPQINEPNYENACEAAIKYCLENLI